MNSRSKGGNFEREICKRLSLWISEGTRTDLFWRSSLSGGRATILHRKGHHVKVQQGDIAAIDPAGHPLTDKFFIECKSYADLRLQTFILANQGTLAQFWNKAKAEAAKYGKVPMLIAKQNRVMPFVLLPWPLYFKDLTYQARLSPPQDCGLALLEDLLNTRFMTLSRTR